LGPDNQNIIAVTKIFSVAAAGNTYVNHWEGKSYMVNVEDSHLKHGGYVLKQHIWNAARDTLAEWTGHQMAECSLYGIRVYNEGAVLAPHVDRLPLVSSAIINVDQDVDEPWPLEVIGHDGKAHNVTMLPGDLVLYESHSVIHGRPFPLKGRFMANVFIHFEPIGPIDGELEIGKSDLPPYIIPGSSEEPNWRKKNPDGHEVSSVLCTNRYVKIQTRTHTHV
jgi:prolyl 4-hydroxylase